MKKTAFLFLASLLTSIFLSGCGKKEPSTPESVEQAAAANKREAEKMAATNQSNVDQAAAEAEAKAKEMAAKAEAEAKKAMEDLKKK